MSGMVHQSCGLTGHLAVQWRLITWFTGGLQVGMRHFNIRKNQYFQPIINLDKLWSLLGHEVLVLTSWSCALV